MILPRNRGPVAEWRFEDGPVEQLVWPVLERSLVYCAIVASILHATKLLNPRVVKLSKWMRAGEREVAKSERVERAEIVLSEDKSKPLSGLFVELFSVGRSILDSETVYPLIIELSGSGAIVESEGDSLVPDLVWIRATTLDILTISVATQSDAWLPFSLKGEPQDKIHALNADRLANALLEIERQTGLKPEEGLQSEYSLIHGYRLDNIRYADGSVADVV